MSRGGKSKRIRRVVWITVTLLFLGVVGLPIWLPGALDAQYNPVVALGVGLPGELATRLHGELQIADLHADPLLWDRDLLARNSRGQVDVPRLIEGNVALQVFSTVSRAPQGPNYQEGRDRVGPLALVQLWPPGTWRSLQKRTLHQADKLHRAAGASGGRLVIVRTAADVDRYLERRRADRNVTAGLLAIEGLHALEGNLENVDRFFDAGFRMMGLVHFFDNALAGSSWGGERHGLTEFGSQVVRRMEELGIVVDLAHGSAKTIDDVLDIATRPVVVSHTGVQATCAGSRNIDDRQILRIADNGGVIGIGFFNAAVCGIEPSQIVRAVRHVADLVGVEHVGIGSDFDGAVRTAFDASGLAQLTQALLSEGFTEEEIRGIMGGNALKVIRGGLPAS